MMTGKYKIMDASDHYVPYVLLDYKRKGNLFRGQFHRARMERLLADDMDFCMLSSVERDLEIAKKFPMTVDVRTLSRAVINVEEMCVGEGIETCAPIDIDFKRDDVQKLIKQLAGGASKPNSSQQENYNEVAQRILIAGCIARHIVQTNNPGVASQIIDCVIKEYDGKKSSRHPEFLHVLNMLKQAKPTPVSQATRPDKKTNSKVKSIAHKK